MLGLSNHTTKKELQHAAGFVEVSKPNIYELAIVPTGLNNLKTKTDDLDVGESSTVRFE